MKRINSKGFAISSLIYGLSIMGFLIVTLLISIMSNNRNNTKSFVEEIESDLNRFSLTETTIAAFSSGIHAQEYTVPQGEGGWYKIELWGASGGAKSGHAGGRGAYTSGVIYLEENTTLYFYIGTQPKNNKGGDGGGGNPNSTTAGGGGATDVRTMSGTWAASYKYRIMVAAGGGGATTTSAGGMGGDITGVKPNNEVGSATQNSGNIPSSSANTVAGAGGGYRSAKANTQGEGGSSYISGYAGCTINTNNNKYFKNGLIIPGTNEGNGKASIKKVDVNLPAKVAMNNIIKIEDCINGKQDITFTDIQLMKDGRNILGSVPSVPSIVKFNGGNKKDLDKVTDGNLDTAFKISQAESSDKNCITITPSTSTYNKFDFDEIAVWHAANKVTNKHELTLTKSDNTIIKLSEASSETLNFTETTNGLHYSAYRSNSSTIQNGTYYIFSATNPSYVFTAGSYPFTKVEQFKNDSSLDQPTKDRNIFEAATTSTTVKLAGITGSKYQKWYIESLGNNNYKISEIQNYNVLQPQEGSNAIGEKISTPTSYTGNEEEQWKITSVGNNLYTIESALEGNNRIINSNNTLLMTNKSNTALTTKFLLVNIDY